MACLSNTSNLLILSFCLLMVSGCLLFFNLFPLKINGHEAAIKPRKGWSLIVFLLSVFCLNYSYQIHVIGHSQGPSSIFYAVINTFQTFTVDLDYGPVTETIAKEIAYNVAGKSYVAFVMLLAPIVGGATIISIIAALFPELKSSLSFWFWKLLKKNIFVFSVLNDQSLTLAEELEKNSLSRPLIIFGNCKTDSNDSEYESLLSRANSKQYICLKQDLATITFGEKHNVTYYFVSNNDITNLDTAAYMADKGLSCWDKCHENTKMIVFAQSDIAKNILEEIISHKEKPDDIRIIPYITNTIYYLFLRHPIFLCQHPTDELTISIIGRNDWATEIFKTILWYGQIPNVKLNINCYVDEPEAYENTLRTLIPELDQFKNSSSQELPYCNWEINTFSSEVINNDKKTNVWFVCSDAEQNSIDTAFFICQNVSAPVSIFYQVHSDSISSALNYSHDTAESYAYHMYSFGSISDQYSRNNIEGCLYELANGFEKSWKNPGAKGTFEVEYKRRSSLAEALHLVFKLYYYGFLTDIEIYNTPDLSTLIKQRLDEEWDDSHQRTYADEIGHMEHNRWIAYMRSIGYSKCTLEELMKLNHQKPSAEIDTKNHFLKKHVAMVQYSSLRKVSRKLEAKGTKRNLQYLTNNSVMSMKKAFLNDQTIQDPEVTMDDQEITKRSDYERS